MTIVLSHMGTFYFGRGNLRPCLKQNMKGIEEPSNTPRVTLVYKRTETVENRAESMKIEEN